MEFTDTFTARHEDLPHNFIPPLTILPSTEVATPKLPIYLFISRECAVCERLFQVELWPFLQRLCLRLSLELKLVDTYLPEAEAFAKGVYDIIRIPVLLYKNQLYSINPAEEEGDEPHGTVIRQLLHFFGVLGAVNYEYVEAGKAPIYPDTIPVHKSPSPYYPRQPRASEEPLSAPKGEAPRVAEVPPSTPPKEEVPPDLF